MRAGMLILKMFILLVLLVSVDILAGAALNALFWKQKSGKYFTTSHAIKNCTEAILIFGNSHAAQDFNPVLIKERTGISAFNFGNQGQGVLYSICLIRSILTYHKPKLIILNLDYRELQRNPAEYERLSIFLPYYHLNKYIDSAIASAGKYEYLKARSAMYRYNSTLGYILLNTYKSSHNKSMATLGADPMDGSFCDAVTHRPKSGEIFENDAAGQLDDNKVKLLIDVINEIKSHNINVLITTTPMYKYDGTANVYKQKLSATLNTLHVDYLDYANNQGFAGNCNLFFDNSHLNASGANKWTGVCIEQIEKYKL